MVITPLMMMLTMVKSSMELLWLFASETFMGVLSLRILYPIFLAKPSDMHSIVTLLSSIRCEDMILLIRLVIYPIEIFLILFGARATDLLFSKALTFRDLIANADIVSTFSPAAFTIVAGFLFFPLLLYSRGDIARDSME